MKEFTANDIFTDLELNQAITILRENERVHDRIRDLIIKPIMPRIDKFTGQENDPDYMAYYLQFIATGISGE